LALNRFIWVRLFVKKTAALDIKPVGTQRYGSQGACLSKNSLDCNIAELQFAFAENGLS